MDFYFLEMQIDIVDKKINIGRQIDRKRKIDRQEDTYGQIDRKGKIDRYHTQMNKYVDDQEYGNVRQIKDTNRFSTNFLPPINFK